MKNEVPHAQGTAAVVRKVLTLGLLVGFSLAAPAGAADAPAAAKAARPPARQAALATPEAFFGQAQTLLQKKDLDGYLELVAPDARDLERRRLENFFRDFEMDSVRLRLAGKRTDADGATHLYCQATFENATAVMMETWQLGLAVRDGRWEIAANDVLGNVSRLFKVRIPGGPAERVRSVEISHRDIRLSFTDAVVFHDNLPGIETAFVILGRGTVRFTPSDAVERHELELLYGRPFLEDSVDQLYVRCSDPFASSNIRIGREEGLPAATGEETARAAAVFSRNYSAIVHDREPSRPRIPVHPAAGRRGRLRVQGPAGRRADLRLLPVLGGGGQPLRPDPGPDRQPLQPERGGEPEGEAVLRQLRRQVRHRPLPARPQLHSCRLLSSRPRPASRSWPGRRGWTRSSSASPRTSRSSGSPTRRNGSSSIPGTGSGSSSMSISSCRRRRRHLAGSRSTTAAGCTRPRRRRTSSPRPSRPASSSSGRATIPTSSPSPACGTRPPRKRTISRRGSSSSCRRNTGASRTASSSRGGAGTRWATSSRSRRRAAPSTRSKRSSRSSTCRSSSASSTGPRRRPSPSPSGPSPRRRSWRATPASSRRRGGSWTSTSGPSAPIRTRSSASSAGSIPRPAATARPPSSSSTRSPGSATIPYPAVSGSPVNLSDWDDYFLAHEIAHQWWGQGVSFLTYKDQWLSEGLAQFAAASYLREKYGERAYAAILAKFSKWTEKKSVKGPIVLGSRLSFLDFEAYQAIIYDKAALVLFMLEDLLGRDVFFAGLKEFFARHKYSAARTETFMAVMERVSGRDLGDFFQGWFRSWELPAVQTSWSDEAGPSGGRLRLRRDPDPGAVRLSALGRVDEPRAKSTGRDSSSTSRARRSSSTSRGRSTASSSIPCRAVPGKFS